MNLSHRSTSYMKKLKEFTNENGTFREDPLSEPGIYVKIRDSHGNPIKPDPVKITEYWLTKNKNKNLIFVLIGIIITLLSLL